MRSQREETRGPPGNGDWVEGKPRDRAAQTGSPDAGPSDTTAQTRESSPRNCYQVQVSLTSKIETSEARAD